jgi:hypothetical protein
VRDCVTLDGVDTTVGAVIAGAVVVSVAGLSEPPPPHPDIASAAIRVKAGRKIEQLFLHR